MYVVVCIMCLSRKTEWSSKQNRRRSEWLRQQHVSNEADKQPRIASLWNLGLERVKEWNATYLEEAEAFMSWHRSIPIGIKLDMQIWSDVVAHIHGRSVPTPLVCFPTTGHRDFRVFRQMRSVA